MLERDINIRGVASRKRFHSKEETTARAKKGICEEKPNKARERYEMVRRRILL